MRRAVMVGVLVAIGASARADLDARLRIVPANGDAPPEIRATVIGAYPPAPADVVLVETDASPPIEMRATRIVPYREDGEPVAIAVVVEGHNLWVTDATLERVRAALELLGDAGPPGSLGELVVYGNGARVPVPMGDLRGLAHASLGDAATYQGIVTRDLASGVERAAVDLRAAPVPRKVLIVIGDGADTDEAAGVTALTRLRDALARDKVDVHAIFYENADDDFEGDVALLHVLAPDAFVASSVEDIVGQAGTIVAEIDRRFDAVFPGYDFDRDVGFTWDGASHAFAVRLGAQRIDGLALPGGPDGYRLPSPRRWPWLLLAGGAALLAFAIVVMVRRREPAFATR